MPDTKAPETPPAKAATKVSGIPEIVQWVEYNTQLGAPLHDTATLIAALKAQGGKAAEPLKPGDVPTLVLPEPEKPKDADKIKVPAEKK